MDFKTRRRVEFRDTDAAGIVHFSAFFPWMESAEHEMLRSVGIPVLPDFSDPDAVTWPRVSVSCDYRGAAHFEDWIDIHVRVMKVGRSSITYEFRFTRDNSGGEESLATGKIVVVSCKLRPGGKLEKAEVPSAIRSKLGSDS